MWALNQLERSFPRLLHMAAVIIMMVAILPDPPAEAAASLLDVDALQPLLLRSFVVAIRLVLLSASGACSRAYSRVVFRVAPRGPRLSL